MSTPPGELIWQNINIRTMPVGRDDIHLSLVMYSSAVNLFTIYRFLQLTPSCMHIIVYNFLVCSLTKPGIVSDHP